MSDQVEVTVAQLKDMLVSATETAAQIPASERKAHEAYLGSVSALIRDGHTQGNPAPVLAAIGMAAGQLDLRGALLISAVYEAGVEAALQKSLSLCEVIILKLVKRAEEEGLVSEEGLQKFVEDAIKIVQEAKVPE